MHRCQLENKDEWKHNIFFQTWEKMEKILLNIMNGYDTYCAFNGVSPECINAYYNFSFWLHALKHIKNLFIACPYTFTYLNIIIVCDGKRKYTSLDEKSINGIVRWLKGQNLNWKHLEF